MQNSQDCWWQEALFPSHNWRSKSLELRSIEMSSTKWWENSMTPSRWKSTHHRPVDWSPKRTPLLSINKCLVNQHKVSTEFITQHPLASHTISSLRGDSYPTISHTRTPTLSTTKSWTKRSSNTELKARLESRANLHSVRWAASSKPSRKSCCIWFSSVVSGTNKSSRKLWTISRSRMSFKTWWRIKRSGWLTNRQTKQCWRKRCHWSAVKVKMLWTLTSLKTAKRSRSRQCWKLRRMHTNKLDLKSMSSSDAISDVLNISSL